MRNFAGSNLELDGHGPFSVPNTDKAYLNFPTHYSIVSICLFNSV